MKSKLKKVFAIASFTIFGALGITFYAADDEIPGGRGGCVEVKCGEGEPEEDPMRGKKQF